MVTTTKEHGQRHKIKPRVILEMILINRMNQRKSKCNRLNFIKIFNSNSDYLIDICNNDDDINERRAEHFLNKIIILIKNHKRKQYKEQATSLFTIGESIIAVADSLSSRD